MSKKNPTLSELEISAIESAKRYYPNADGTHEALIEATKNMYKALMKLTGDEFSKLEKTYNFLMRLSEKIRKSPQLILALEAA